LCSFGTFSPVLISRTNKNLATLHYSSRFFHMASNDTRNPFPGVRGEPKQAEAHPGHPAAEPGI
jgi:hypothetical protein